MPGRKYPDFFPGSIKYVPKEDGHLFFCALACVQYMIEHDLNAEKRFDELVLKFSSKRFQRFYEKVDHKKPKLADAIGKYIINNLDQNKKGPSFRLWLQIMFLTPDILMNIDFFTLFKHIHYFIRDIFNRDPANPKIIGSPWLYYAIMTATKLTHVKIDPYEYDKIHRPISAEIALVRPRTQEGRKIKRQYDAVMKRFMKITDKYYRNGARKWAHARVLCSSVAQAETDLGIAQGELHKFLYKEPWDIAMGYRKS